MLRKISVLALLLVAVCGVSFGQVSHTYPALDTNNVFTGPNQFNGPFILLPNVVAGLSPSAVAGQLVIVTDGVTTTDCTVGGGHLKAFCEFDGTQWSAFGAGLTVSWGTITGTLSDQTDLQTALDGKAAYNASIQINSVPCTLSMSCTISGFTGNLAGDVTGPQAATTVVKINNGVIPLNASVLGTNGLGQVVDKSSASLLNGDVTGPLGSNSVVKVNGASIPLTQPIICTNGSGQFIICSSPLPVANGGTGTSSPSLTAGFGIGITGTWPFNTIAQSGTPLRRTCAIVVGSDDASSALVDTNLGPQGRLCFIPSNATVLEVEVAADAGTPNVIVAKHHGSTITNLISSALATAASGGIACSNTGGTTGIDGATTCSGTLQNTSLSAGDYLELVSGTAGGTAKRMSIFITWTVNI